jgi:hypothetical protein
MGDQRGGGTSAGTRNLDVAEITNVHLIGNGIEFNGSSWYAVF